MSPEYAFTLRYALPSPTCDVDDIVERLGAGGCDDALVGIGRKGRIALDFLREAGSAGEAVMSAIADVRAAVPEAKLVEAAPDLVGLTGVAELLGVSRQNVRKLIVECRGISPAPVYEGRPSVWHLAKLLRWLRDEKRYPVGDSLLSLADTTMQVNIALQASSADRSLQARIRGLLV